MGTLIAMSSPMDQGHLEINRRSWDERTPLHVGSPLYDLDSFVAGRSTLHPVEPEELGPVEGCTLLHLQCHIGTDTLSWARRGASVTGLDFSGASIEAAQELAERCGLEATFIRSDVYEAAEVLGETYDVVYTGLGALNWLNDVQRWAEVIAQLVAPGGRFYLLEFHPLMFALADDDIALDPAYSYFHDPAGVSLEDDRDYADPSARLAEARTVEWAHTIGDVVTALIDAGLEIRMLKEHDVVAFNPWPSLERVPGEAALWRAPKGKPHVPFEYSLLATRPPR